MFTLDFNGKPYIKADNAAPLFFIAGPCAMESRAHALEVSAALKEIFAEAGIPFLYKSSFDKANRSSGAGFRGVGMKEGLSILAEVRESLRLVGAPYEPEHIGVSRERLRKTLSYIPYMRSRFANIDVVYRCGYMNELTEHLFGKGGIWECGE